MQICVRFEVGLHAVHHHEDLVGAAARDDFAHVDDILMLERQQKVDLAEGRDGEALLALEHLDLLERHDLACRAISRFPHHAVRPLVDLLHAFVTVDRTASPEHRHRFAGERGGEVRLARDSALDRVGANARRARLRLRGRQARGLGALARCGRLHRGRSRSRRFVLLVRVIPARALHRSPFTRPRWVPFLRSREGGRSAKSCEGCQAGAAHASGWRPTTTSRPRW